MIVLASHGARLAVLAPDASLLDGFEQRLPYGCTIEAHAERLSEVEGEIDARFRIQRGGRGTEASSPRPFRIFDERELLLQAPDLATILDRLDSELHFAVASHARSALFVHAGVVGWNGRAIVIPGRSMTGKTTLVRALVDASADYYSDEYAVLDERGLVHPYPRPLGVRLPGGGGTKLLPESLGCRIGGEPLPLGLIVTTRFREGASFAPETAGSARGLMALIDNTVVVRERSHFALDRLAPAARGAVTLEGERGAASEAADFLLKPEPWER